MSKFCYNCQMGYDDCACNKGDRAPYVNEWEDRLIEWIDKKKAYSIAAQLLKEYVNEK